MTDYRDPKPVTPATPEYVLTRKINPLIPKYAKFVREKMYGKDVREAIARSIELSGEDSGQALDIAEDTQNRLDNQLAGLTSDSEIIDFRYSEVFKRTYQILKDRGVFWDESLVALGVDPYWFLENKEVLTSKHIQQALELSSTLKTYVNLKGRDYEILKPLVLKKGSKGILGQGATLKVNSGVKYIDVIRDYEDVDNNQEFVNYLRLTDLKIEMNGLSGSSGIRLRGSFNYLSNIDIKGFTGSGNRGIRLFYGASRNVIESCNIDLPQQYDGHVDNQCISIIGKAFSQNAGLEDHDTVQEGSLSCLRNEVLNCHLIGGSHTLAIQQSYYTRVQGNTIRNGSARGIILSPRACYSLIDSNTIIDPGSSGIHLAYGSDFNKISNNLIVKESYKPVSESDTSNNFFGEAGIQIYKYCDYNSVEGNTVVSKWTYGISVAVACSNTSIKNNLVTGGILACISVESDLTATTKEYKYGRPNYENPINKNWATWANNNDTFNIVISDNVLRKLEDSIAKESAGINIHQLGTNSGLRLIHVSNNSVFDANLGATYCVNVSTPARFSENSLTGNKTSSIDPSKFQTNNRDLKFREFFGNYWQTLTGVFDKDTQFNILQASFFDFWVLKDNVTVSNILGSLSNGRQLTIIVTTGSQLKTGGNLILSQADTKPTSGNLTIGLTYIEQLSKFVETYRVKS